jgi:hypothetical protein
MFLISNRQNFENQLRGMIHRMDALAQVDISYLDEIELVTVSNGQALLRIPRAGGLANAIFEAWLRADFVPLAEGALINLGEPNRVKIFLK